MWKCTGVLVGIVVALAMVQACGGSPGIMTGPQGTELGPFPVEFRDTVQDHVLASFPRGRVQRNIIVRPPFAAWVEVEGQRLAGHAGQVDFSLKDEEKQAFQRMTYCYFLYRDEILAFEDHDHVGWCNRNE